MLTHAKKCYIRRRVSVMVGSKLCVYKMEWQGVLFEV